MNNEEEELINEIDKYVLIKKNYDLNNSIIEMKNSDLEKLLKKQQEIKDQNGKNITAFIINTGVAVSLTYISISIFREKIEYMITATSDFFTKYLLSSNNWMYAVLVFAGCIGAVGDLVLTTSDYSKSERKNVKISLKKTKKELIKLKNIENELNNSLENTKLSIENQYEELPYDIKKSEIVKQKMLLLDINKEKETS